MSDRLGALEKARSTNQTSMVTYLMSSKSRLADGIRHLQKEYTTASNIKDRANRKAVQTALSDMVQNLKGLKCLPCNGIAVYSGQLI